MKNTKKTNAEISIEIVKHKKHWQKEYGSWGNGYIHIPKEHPIYNHIISKEEHWGFMDSFCGEEITYNCETKTGYCIGFDTLHTYNGKHNTKQWVVDKCNAIKDYLNSAKYLKEVINEMKNKHQRIADENARLQVDIYKLERIYLKKIN
tara:strand:+ start:4878 stop:5324 length:447 start_codon:yes stop_codon:yes gene_type:complete